MRRASLSGEQAKKLQAALDHQMQTQAVLEEVVSKYEKEGHCRPKCPGCKQQKDLFDQIKQQAKPPVSLDELKRELIDLTQDDDE